jgi:integrative and conjugative element protein (TIGR02256 family)
MHLLLTATVLKRLRRELRRAGSQEVGGLLMGEHVRDEVFRVVDISVQRSGGSRAHFVRDPANHGAQLRSFFARTGRDFTRFNYLGEWHSHPMFEPLPSAVDIATMQSLVEDPAVGANFLILLIATLTAARRIEVSATLFVPKALPVSVAIEYEHADSNVRGVRRILRYLSEWSNSMNG